MKPNQPKNNTLIRNLFVFPCHLLNSINVSRFYFDHDFFSPFTIAPSNVFDELTNWRIFSIFFLFQFTPLSVIRGINFMKFCMKPIEFHFFFSPDWNKRTKKLYLMSVFRVSHTSLHASGAHKFLFVYSDTADTLKWKLMKKKIWSNALYWMERAKNTKKNREKKIQKNKTICPNAVVECCSTRLVSELLLLLLLLVHFVIDESNLIIFISSYA